VDVVKPGNRVFVAALRTPGCTGTYAELAVVAATAVHPLPSSLSFAQGAAIGIPCVTAWRALFQRARLQPGETVFVHGASGGVGLHTVQLARATGAVVIGSASTPEGADLVREAGATHVLNHGTAGYLEELARITDGRGPSVIIEMAAHLNLEKDLTVLATGGRVVIVGSRGSLDFTPRLAMVKEAAILGLALWNATPAEMADALTGVAAHLREGALAPVVGVTLPLREAATAHHRVLEQGTRGKLVLISE